VQGEQFVDRQVSGPFRSWKHTHRFLPDINGGCVISDEIEFQLPLPVPFAAAFVKSQLDRLFDYREEVLKKEFGG
jgi:ligand-binding SRPBCC domain-containing protein